MLNITTYAKKSDASSNTKTEFSLKNLLTKKKTNGKESSKTQVQTETNTVKSELVSKTKVQAETTAVTKEPEKKEPEKKTTSMTVQVLTLEATNLSASESAWLPNQIQDKLKSNVQDYLGMRTVVDSKAESTLKKLQAESEGSGRDEAAALELGKISTAKYALFTKIRKTGNGYTISVDFTDLTTGEQKASVSSKEYSRTEYLYGSTGAVDEITLALANKLGIKLSGITENLLTAGSSNFSVDEQLALAKQNEDAFRKQMQNFDDEIRRLSVSNDINAIQNKNRIEAEKALLAEKQNAERRRQDELIAQKKRQEEDSKLEAERSIALKTQRDQMAKEAAAKAAEVRKLKMEKQGVLGQINVIESKKKALVEIRQGVENRSLELYAQKEKDQQTEENRIRNKSYSTVEVGSDGKPTEAALKRRENQIIKSYEDLENKFFADCESVKQSTMAQQNALLAEIRADQKAIQGSRSVNSMGEELKVNFGKYEGSQNGWNAYLSLYSDGVLIYTDNFIVNYESLSGKKAPNMETELNDSVIEEYTNNVDMYNSLLTRGAPIIYFEIDYSVVAESDNKPSEYKFNFSRIRVINTVSGKITQNSALSKVESRTMKPEQEIRIFAGVVEKEKARFASETYKLEVYMAKGQSIEEAKKSVERAESLGIFMVDIPNKNYSAMKTEVTQKLYEAVMGENPSRSKGENNPVENVSWYDAIYFCNKLSEMVGYTPVYALYGNTDVNKWNYRPHGHWHIKGHISQNQNADGFRLPTEAEWEYAAKGGENYKYSGGNNIDEVAWYKSNSGGIHPVAQKKANGYGLYDMSGNVWEWCFDSYSDGYRCRPGGSWFNDAEYCEVGIRSCDFPDDRDDVLGFRLVRTTK